MLLLRLSGAGILSGVCFHRGFPDGAQRHIVFFGQDCDILVCAFGATARVVKSAVNDARAQGIKAGLFRPKTLWPFPVKEINEAAKNAKCLLSVEMSMGQMVDDIKLAINCSKPVHFYGRMGGNLPTQKEILDKIIAIHNNPNEGGRG